MKQLLKDTCSLTFTADDWDIEQEVALTATIDNQIDGNRGAEFKISASLVVDGVETETKPVKEYSVRYNYHI